MKLSSPLRLVPQLVNRQASGSTGPAAPTPRKVKFDWSKTPLDWIPGEPFTSAFINEINLILPAGEFWFCRLFNQALPHITDEQLSEDVRAFIKQEAMHARAHGGATKDYLNHHGVNTERNTRFMNWLFEKPFADDPFGQQIPEQFQKQWLVFRVGLVAAIEHMTCVLGMYVLNNKAWDEKGADPVLLDLLRWHGAEEVEHRCVAFDVYQHLGGNYLSRYYLASLAFPAIFAIWVDGAADLLRQDPRFASKKPSVFRPWMWRQWSKTARRGLLPHPLWLMRKNLPYLSPLYKPANEGSTAEALEYLNGSVAYHAALAG